MPAPAYEMSARAWEILVSPPTRAVLQRQRSGCREAGTKHTLSMRVKATPGNFEPVSACVIIVFVLTGEMIQQLKSSTSRKCSSGRRQEWPVMVFHSYHQRRMIDFVTHCPWVVLMQGLSWQRVLMFSLIGVFPFTAWCLACSIVPLVSPSSGWSDWIKAETYLIMLWPSFRYALCLADKHPRPG